ncbi:MAG: hypothetical protein Q9164_002214 [Protoblastenia rupestris]
MSHTVFPHSSRDSSPLLDGSSNTTSRRTSSSTTTSINDLSQFLTRHTLTTRRSSISLDTRLHNPLANPPRTTSRLINSRRQSLIRRQNSSSHLDRVATLVDDLLQNNQYIAYPSTLDEDISSPSLSPDELPTIRNSYLNLMHHPSAAHVPNAEDVTSRHPHQLDPDYYKMNKDMRHMTSSHTLNRGKERVMKPIKMRIRSKRRPKKKG